VPRAAGILIENNQIALIRRCRHGRTYYLLPGGHTQDNETLVETVQRELLEELGVTVTVGRLIAEVVYCSQRQSYFLVTWVAGEFGTGRGEEMIGLADPADGTYDPVWMPVADVLREPVLPGCLCKIIVHAFTEGSWPETVIALRDEPAV